MSEYKTAIVRVWNDKCDLTYLYSLYKESNHDEILEIAKYNCRRWMKDCFNIKPEDTEDVKVEFLFNFVTDGILHNDYFKGE
jgi:hypothetical protein